MDKRNSVEIEPFVGHRWHSNYCSGRSQAFRRWQKIFNISLSCQLPTCRGFVITKAKAKHVKSQSGKAKNVKSQSGKKYKNVTNGYNTLNGYNVTKMVQKRFMLGTSLFGSCRKTHLGGGEQFLSLWGHKKLGPSDHHPGPPGVCIPNEKQKPPLLNLTIPNHSTQSNVSYPNIMLCNLAQPTLTEPSLD